MGEVIELDEYEWAREQTCRSLRNDDEVAIAKQFLNVRQFPLHNDRWKNWDNFLAVHHVRRLLKKDDPVLDAGACRDPGSPSVFLPALAKDGFTDLTGINLDEGAPIEVDGVKYEYGDVEEMAFPSQHFRFVACLSVIEHGVDVMKFFREVSRVLKPEGYLFVSFDYWEDTVDTKGQMAFGKPIKVFDELDVMKMLLYAKIECGLEAMKRPDLGCYGNPVEWMGMRYTFLNLLLHKPG